jgi:hypothetical protein
MDHIKETLPTLRVKIHQQIAKHEEELHSYGKPLSAADHVIIT